MKIELDSIMNYQILSLFFRLGTLTLISFFTLKIMLEILEPNRKQKYKVHKRAKDILLRLGVKSDVEFNEHELLMANSLVDSNSINVSWEDIAGLDDVLEELLETVILPVQNRHLFLNSSLICAPKGVLLYGPPGCGKTMIAKAVARRARTNFLNLDVSILTDKWYGESQKLTAAIFSLATKIQPCIIFIDEIDSLLRYRTSQDHEATAMIKTLFMQLWDGLSTDENANVLIMGATNRPQDIDTAIRRRMPANFHIGMPNTQQRRLILRQILRKEDVNLGDDHESDDWNTLAEATSNFSGSDLLELCRTASIYRLKCGISTSSDSQQSTLRPIELFDLIRALKRIESSC